jgi:hypothetical protein
LSIPSFSGRLSLSTSCPARPPLASTLWYGLGIMDSYDTAVRVNFGVAMLLSCSGERARVETEQHRWAGQTGNVMIDLAE